ncbi:MAG: DNA polymerase III subunit alpha [Minisyncoccia bacterium]
MSKFTHLHTHSHYSLLNALPKIKDLIDEAKKNDMSALALTDNCNLYGAIEFYIQCKKKGVKPIIGIDAYVAIRGRKDKQSIDKERYRLVLLAKNDIGYKNLIKLVTYAHLEGFYYKPRIDNELLEKYSDGLIAIAPSFSSDIVLSIKLANQNQALERLDWYKSVFNKNSEENFFLEITHHPEMKGHEETMQKVVEFAKKTNTPLVASHDVYYLHPEDREARQTLIAVASQNDEKLEFKEENFSFISQSDALEFFKNIPEAIENIEKIVERCNLEIEIGKWSLPNYVVESGLSYDDELRRITVEGIKKRKLEKTKEIVERMEYELKIIKDKGYAPYFLVVSDLLNFAHENGILTTIRGSVAGSLVTFLSGITNVNPLEYNLPFERFLNPYRPSAPDIDMDFADNRRDEVIEYAKKKYGEDKVAQIGTFGTMAARGAVRDVTRALGFPYSLGDSISKLIPLGKQGFPMTIDRALKEEPELSRRYKEEPDVKKIIDMAKKIEGCARHISVHAAGVVMAPTPLIDYVPLQYDTKGGENGQHKIITQYDMHSVGEDGVGLLKFDFLGIRNLSILADSVKRVEKIEGIKIDIENVPVDDKKTFDMLARGETIGLFQLNGDGMTRALKDLKPTVIHDINVMVALYRPGPMDNINEYIARKHGKKPIVYLHPKMKNFLDKTFGVLVYQDDLLYTAIEVAGYDWGEVDKFRKAVGKKIPEEMKKQHIKFVEGSQKHGGMSEKKAEELWNLFEPFQGYGFNMAHAVSYGKVAYQTAYMKANFPAIYMSAVLTAESGNIETVAEVINECKRMGIPVLPPDVNKSFEGFGVNKSNIELHTSIPDTIRFGLSTIKNFGEGIAHSIVEERKKNGEFTSLSDFLRRVKDKNLNKKSLESLIKAGAMDSLAGGSDDRSMLLSNIDKMLQFSREERQDMGDQTSLFFGTEIKATEIKLELNGKTTQGDKLMWEKELLGLYISGHPLDSYKDKLENKNLNIKKIKESKKDKDEVVFGGIIEELRPVMTKKGEKMYFLKVSDLSDSIEAVAFPKILTEESSGLFAVENCVVIKGSVSLRNGEKSVLIDKIRLME